MMSNMGKDSQHYSRGTREEEAGLAGSGVSGYHKASGKAQCMHFYWIFSLVKPSKKMFENHYTITYSDALPLDFRVMESAAVQEIPWVNRIH